MNKKPKSLEPYREVSIDTKTVVFGVILFAIVFWTVGSLFRYYVPIGV